MAHKSRIGVICIDCKTDDLSDATGFWSAMLGKEAKLDERGKYASFDGHQGYPKVLLQAVDHEPRVHLDIETDDLEAECERLKGLGATEVARVRTWIVMEAPTGHRFCLVNPQGADWPGEAPSFNGDSA
ncbi:VOC family protein [Ruegeria sp. 2205SS24-7]|uniref:VOC family protein n=1 Tax=Ruegeria discodermiae TaxID=3064389 RepID=UPI0027424B48|nr:VOC family protein [Ruegeria sp. 2205SS24-7]MDP5218370.1 VOC family protein [Ruegeria sp. 2205SS24-7]